MSETPQDAIDYRTLLRKYIAHVTDCEGIAYIADYRGHYMSDVDFTFEEWAELKRLEAEGRP